MGKTKKAPRKEGKPKGMTKKKRRAEESAPRTAVDEAPRAGFQENAPAKRKNKKMKAEPRAELEEEPLAKQRKIGLEDEGMLTPAAKSDET
ncbi:hypothetical protein R1flu_024992 [Riccia fluitans]|uniref:Uncharacterized protein n=1 Tax=Riccia fluitans TaxID=41844 RepID=A0ABD1XWV8_9MARC